MKPAEQKRIYAKFAAEYSKKLIVHPKNALYLTYKQYFYQLVVQEVQPGMEKLGFEFKDGYIQRKAQGTF